MLGFTAGKIPSIALNLPLVKEAAIVGVFWNSWIQRRPDEHHDNMSRLYQLYHDGKINPLISGAYPLEKYEEAFLCLAERRALGRIILTL